VGAPLAALLLKALAVLLPPTGAFLAVYVAALVALFISAFWTVDIFHRPDDSPLERSNNFASSGTAASTTTSPLRTILIAAAVTVTDAIIAFPFAYFMARVATPRMRAVLFVLVLLPLWRRTSHASTRAVDPQLERHPQLVAAQARARLGEPALHEHCDVDRVLLHLAPVHDPAVYAALERIPHSYIEASRDLGGKGTRTLRSIILPLALPGIVAGSIFTFSLTSVTTSRPCSSVAPRRSHRQRRLRRGEPIVRTCRSRRIRRRPVAVMGAYLLIARRLGAFEAL